MRERRPQDRKGERRRSGRLGYPGGHMGTNAKRSDGQSSWGHVGMTSTVTTSSQRARLPARDPGLCVAPSPRWPHQLIRESAEPPPTSCRAWSSAASAKAQERAPPPTPAGTASARNKKGNLINSFHIQHFPHSIIFKLNNLSRGEKGKSPLSSALPSLTKPTLWGPDGERLRGARPSMPLFIVTLTGSPSDCPCVVETLAHSHTASVGLLSAPGSPGGGTEQSGWSENPAKENSYRRRRGETRGVAGMRSCCAVWYFH